MSLLSKIFTIIRSAGHELKTTLVDTQAIRILDHQVCDAKKTLDFAKVNLTEVITERKIVEREIKKLEKTIHQHEEYAKKALALNDEALALEITEKIAVMFNQCKIQRGIEKNYAEQIINLKQNIEKANNNIQLVEIDLAAVKTTENVHRANDAITDKFAGLDSPLQSATDSLERIKIKQQQKKDQMLVAKELLELEQNQDVDLHVKLQKAGIITSARNN
jgi:phage shock protein A